VFEDAFLRAVRDSARIGGSAVTFQVAVTISTLSRMDGGAACYLHRENGVP
jgi:hypothetical protein